MQYSLNKPVNSKRVQARKRPYRAPSISLPLQPATAPSELDPALSAPPVTAPVGGARKRVFDVICASAILIGVTPLFLMLTIIIKLRGDGPVVFRHTRIGFDGRRFDCIKFRTMVVDAEQKLADHLAADPDAAEEWGRDQKLRSDPRVTRIGAVLRKTSLDELPQLFNVLRGDMSLVGPRPVIEDELARYGAFRSAYLSARPGMTGLWQVSGRNSTTYERRTELDATYVRDWRLRNDIAIIMKTVPEVLMSSRAY